MKPLFGESAGGQPEEGEKEDPTLDYVENVLRQAAILDPELFLARVQHVNGLPGKRSQRLEDLVDHGNLMLSLRPPPPPHCHHHHHCPP